MIHTSKQLKDKVRNVSGGDNNVAKTLIRNFIMERFLERVSKSPYNDNFILKGGMLVASMVGSDMRATMDIDTTVKSLPLNEEDAQRIVSEICNITIGDGISFRITSVETIMDEFEYPGIRMKLEATLDRMRQVIKIDISTDDIITPSAIEYDYKLLFEERTISLLTYNKETLLSEKIQTILARGIANTRLRDFYDVYNIMEIYETQIDKQILFNAFYATCTRRKTMFSKAEIEETMQLICNDAYMEELWNRFKNKNYFVGALDWKKVIESVTVSVKRCISDRLD